MTVQVLLSTMNQEGFEIAHKCRIASNCLIINQCGYNKQLMEVHEYGDLQLICTSEKGLSKSRNMALREATGDICIICDDDIIYHDGYADVVKTAFKEIPDADLIVFNINSLNTQIRPQETLFNAIKRIPRVKTYSSVHIAFKRKSVQNAGICFNEKFGSGSGMYSMAEDSIFFNDVHRAGLKAYTYPAVIADLKVEKSSWFQGFNPKYFFDTGAFLAAAHPKSKYLRSFYYPIRVKEKSFVGSLESLRWIWKGIKGYKHNLSYVMTLDT